MSIKKIFVFDDEWDAMQDSFEQVVPVLEEALGYPVRFEGLAYDEARPRDLQLQEALDRLLGLEDGDIGIRAVLLDVQFEHPNDGTHYCFDPLPNARIDGQTIIDELLGSGVPTIILSQHKALEYGLKSGREHITWLAKDELVNAPVAFAKDLAKKLRHEFANLRFNEDTLEIENKFARGYDADELGSLATRAVILWETDRVLTAFRTAINRFGRPLRVLDIGCGTGRFEELLLKHTDTRPFVEQIVAVDFAPMYLVCARQRLAKLGLANELKQKVIFKRRIAEDLRLPSGFFDVVLVAFGVPCFSQYTRSIPEAARVLTDEGVAVFTGYNHNSLNFEYEEGFSQPSSGRRRSFFTADIDRQKGTMTLPNQPPFACHTFTPNFFIEIVRQSLHVADGSAFGLAVDYTPVETFPVLHGCSSRTCIEQIAGTNGEALAAAPVLSYMPAAIEAYPGFSRELFMIDRELCRLSALRDRGHYINIIATK